MSNDKGQHCDTSPAKSQKCMPKERMLFAFSHSSVMQICVACNGNLQEND